MRKKEIIEACEIRRVKVKRECAWRTMIATANGRKWEAWTELSGSRLDRDFFSTNHNYIVEPTASGLMETDSIHHLKNDLTRLMIKLLNVMSSKKPISVSWEDILREDHSLHIFFVIHTFLYPFADKGGGLTRCGDSVSLQLGPAYRNSQIPGQLIPLSWHIEHGWLPPVASGEQK